MLSISCLKVFPVGRVFLKWRRLELQAPEGSVEPPEVHALTGQALPVGIRAVGSSL